MVPDHDADPAALYDHERVAFVAQVAALTTAELSRRVPATPAWTIRDVVAHLVGIPADLNAQRFGDGDGDAWTAAQVAARRHATLVELAAEWEAEAPRFTEGLRQFGYEWGAHYLGDLLQHVGDVQHALGRSPRRDDLTVSVALDFYLTSFEETVDAAGLGAVAVATDDERWVVGSGEVRASVRAPVWELFRSLGGRRTGDEIAELAWGGDALAVIPLFSRYPVPLRSLGER